MKREPIIWENIFANDTSDKSLISKYMKNSHDSALRRQATQLRNGQRTWTDTSLRRTYRESRDMKRCSVLLAIREMQINTTMRYQFIPVRMAITKCQKNSNKDYNEALPHTHQNGCHQQINKQVLVRMWRKGNTLMHCLWEWRPEQPLWKMVWRVLKIKNGTAL